MIPIPGLYDGYEPHEDEASVRAQRAPRRAKRDTPPLLRSATLDYPQIRTYLIPFSGGDLEIELFLTHDRTNAELEAEP